MSENTSSPVGDVEILPAWDGPAIHAPGVLFDVRQKDGKVPNAGPLAELAGWVALRAFSGVTGNPVCEAIKAKVRDVLKAWRLQEGQARFDELKLHVVDEMQKHRANGKLTEEELRQRMDVFFQEIEA